MYTAGGITAPESVFSKLMIHEDYLVNNRALKRSIFHENPQKSLKSLSNFIANPFPNRVIITIDGLSGAGKTTVGIKLAESFRIVHMESGYIFKAVAKAMLENQDGYCMDSVSLVERKLAQVTVFDIADPTLDQWNYAKLVPTISGLQEVQDSFYKAVRRLSNHLGSSAITGRSIGSNMSQASSKIMKFFLKVSPATAAYRKSMQMEELESPSAIELSTLRRNKQDIAHNIVSVPRGAIVIDTDNMTLEEVELAIETTIRRSFLSRFS